MINEFSAVSIKKASLQFITGGVAEAGTPFGCMGTLDAETEMVEKTKNCEGVIETISIPQYMTVTVAGHVKRDVLRELFGITTEGLKEGIYSYGISSKGKRFIFTADVIDEFEDVVQLIAFPKGSSVTGLTLSIDNDADEVPYMELEFRANADELGNFYYEAFYDEVEETIQTDWHTGFTTELIQTPETPEV